MPLVYLLLVPFFYQATALTGGLRTFRMLRVACLIHTAWFTLAVFRLLPPISIGPISDVPAFTTRGDFDLLIAGLSIAVFLLDREWARGIRALLTLLAGASLLAGGSRAGLISGLILLGLAFVLARPKGHRISPVLIAGSALFVAAVVPFVVSVFTDPPTWMRAVTRLFDTGSQEQASAQNTWGARLDAWQRILEYTTQNPTQTWWGSGLGSQPILNSGAVVYLSGDPSVRAAHNFAVTWLAFFGIVGGVAICSVLLLWTLGAFKNAARVRGITGVGTSLIVAVIAAGLGGVIVESPFGYMTLIAGIALAYQGVPFAYSATQSTSPRPQPATAGSKRRFDKNNARLNSPSRNA